MTSGLPDYGLGVRPQYGGAKFVKAVTAVLANVKTSLISVTGKGMIYGGELRVLGTERQMLDVPILSIDGVEISDTNFDNMRGWGFDVERVAPFYIRHFDGVNFLYSVGLTNGFTFESSFEILYDEKDGGTPGVSCRAYYALL